MNHPLRQVQPFRAKLLQAQAFYRKCTLPWMFVVPDKWVAPGQHPVLEDMLQQEGFQLAMEAQAVVAESRPAITDSKLVIEPALTNDDWETIASINADSWNVPLHWVKPLLCSPVFQEQARGWLGSADEGPASCAITFPAEPYTFLAWVATLPAHRKRGYGDSLIRHAAQAGGIGPLCCLSSPQALNVWVAAGFKPAERFRFYMAPA